MSAGNQTPAANTAAEVVIDASPAIHRRLHPDPIDQGRGPPLVVTYDENGYVVKILCEADDGYAAELEIATREECESRDSVRRSFIESARAKEIVEEALAAAAASRPMLDVVPGEGEAALISANDIEPEKIDWIWPDWLARGKLCVLAGAPGTSKTTAALALAAAITSGTELPDGSPAPVSHVVMWSGEDSAGDTLLPRFLALGGNRDRMHFVSGLKVDSVRRPFDPSTDMPALSKAVSRLGGVGLVIIDSIASVVGSQSNSHNNAETRRALQPVVNLAERHNACVLGIAHYTKNTAGNDPLERVMGSIAFGALARVVLGAAAIRNEKTERILVRAKSNIGPAGDGFRYRLALKPVPGYPDLGAACTVAWGEPLTGSARDLINAAEADAKPNKIEQAADLIGSLLEAKGGRIKTAELKAATLGVGIGDNTFHQAIKQLGLSRKRPGGRGDWVYELPPEKLFVLPAYVGDTDPNADLTMEGAA